MLDKIFKRINRILPAKYRWILNHDGFKRYFSNTGWMFGGQGITLLVSFFIGAWVTRYLGPSNYGAMSYALAFVGLFAFISDLGSGAILNRELVKHREKRDELMGTAFRLKLIGGIISMTLVIIVAFLIKTSPLVRLLIIIFSASSILQVINVISFYFQARVEAKKNVQVRAIATLISAALKVLIILSGKGIIFLVIVYLLDLVWQGIGFIIQYRQEGLRLRDWYFKSKLAKRIWKSSWPLMLAAAAGYIYSKIDQVMIGLMLNNLEVGLYAAAVKLSEVWYFIPGIISVSLFPAIVNARQSNQVSYHQRLRGLYTLMTTISLAIVVPVALLAKPLILWLYGIKYLASVPVLQIYIWSNLALFLWIALSQYLMAEDKVRTIFFVNIFAMIINVGLNLILIPIMGIRGAALATLISYSTLPAGVWIVDHTKLSAIINRSQGDFQYPED